MNAQVQALARALYETDSGAGGYPPLHESVPWVEVTYRDHHIKRAQRILALLRTPSDTDALVARSDANALDALTRALDR